MSPYVGLNDIINIISIAISSEIELIIFVSIYAAQA